MPTSSATRLVEVKRVPPSVAPAGLKNEKAAGTGSILVTSFRVFPFLPFRQQWIARITEFEWNHHFADVQERGPFQSWHHRHEFAASSRNGTSGTAIRDVIDYEIGFGFLGRAADALLVRRQMDSTFRERQRKLPELLRK